MAGTVGDFFSPNGNSFGGMSTPPPMATLGRSLYPGDTRGYGSNNLGSLPPPTGNLGNSGSTTPNSPFFGGANPTTNAHGFDNFFRMRTLRPPASEQQSGFWQPQNQSLHPYLTRDDSGQRNAMNWLNQQGLGGALSNADFNTITNYLSNPVGYAPQYQTIENQIRNSVRGNSLFGTYSPDQINNLVQNLPLYLASAFGFAPPQSVQDLMMPNTNLPGIRLGT